MLSCKDANGQYQECADDIYSLGDFSISAYSYEDGSDGKEPVSKIRIVSPDLMYAAIHTEESNRFLGQGCLNDYIIRYYSVTIADNDYIIENQDEYGQGDKILNTIEIFGLQVLLEEKLELGVEYSFKVNYVCLRLNPLPGTIGTFLKNWNDKFYQNDDVVLKYEGYEKKFSLTEADSVEHFLDIY